MKPLSALPYIEWTEDDGSIDRIYADVVTDEAGGLPADATDFPIEKGITASDNYRKGPESFRLKMTFSGSPIRGDLDSENAGSAQDAKLTYRPFPPGPPLYTPGGATKAVEGLVGSLFGGSDGPPQSMRALQFDDPPFNRFEKILNQIRRFQSGGILVTIKSTFGRFENMAILDANPHRSAETGDGAELDLDCKELRFISSETSIGAPLPAEPRGQPKKTGVNAGNGSEVAGDRKDSVAKALKGWLAGGGGVHL